jgi:hypothetical protein
MNNIKKNDIPEKNYRDWYSWEHLKAYPNLYKLLILDNRTRHYHYLMAILEKIQHGTNYAHGFLAQRYLAKKFNVSMSKANKILNFFCALKIITKERQRMKDGITDPKLAITYQIAPRNENYLRMIDERAAIFQAKKLTLNIISWEAIRSCFGEDEANEIYSLREETQINGFPKKRNRGLIPELYEECFITSLEELTYEKGWTNKAALIEAVQRIIGDKPGVVEERFSQFKPSLLDNGYRYKMTSKADAATVPYELPTGRYLIFKI